MPRWPRWILLAVVAAGVALVAGLGLVREARSPARSHPASVHPAVPH